jgi:hypothetical protein
VMGRRDDGMREWWQILSGRQIGSFHPVQLSGCLSDEREPVTLTP